MGIFVEVTKIYQRKTNIADFAAVKAFQTGLKVTEALPTDEFQVKKSPAVNPYKLIGSMLLYKKIKRMN